MPVLRGLELLDYHTTIISKYQSKKIVQEFQHDYFPVEIISLTAFLDIRTLRNFELILLCKLGAIDFQFNQKKGIKRQMMRMLGLR
mgnify:CR=1 FL=1